MKTTFWTLPVTALACVSLAGPLRAEDQTAAPKSTPSAPKVEQPSPKVDNAEVSVEGVGTYVHVDGDRDRFRADHWMDDPWTGGVQEFTYQRNLDKTTTLKMTGRGIFDQHDYAVGLELVRPEVGFVRVGFTQYRKYFDDSGGFSKPFSKPSFDTGKDLDLDIGRIFIDVGVTLPNVPKITLGYERDYKTGRKSMLEWGSVTETITPPPTMPSGTITKKIAPTFKDIDETVDIFKLDLQHDIKNVHLGNEFRYEHYQNSTYRLDDSSINLTTLTSTSVRVKEDFTHDNFSDVFHMESWVNEKTYWSAGYLFSALSGDAGIRINTVPMANVRDKNWFARSIDIDQESHVLNLNLYYEPIKNLCGYAGLQGEMTDGEGDGTGTLTEVTAAGPVISSPVAAIHTDTRKQSIEELLGLRYTGIPFTTLYAEGRWTQQVVDLFERELEDGSLDGNSAFSRRTETSVDRQQYTIGFNTSPLARVTWSGRYRHSERNNDYDNQKDYKTTGGAITPNGGYSAFLRWQQFETDEVMTKVSVRPHARVNLTFQYQLVSTEIRTSNEDVSFLGIPQGSLQSGDYDAHIYSAGVTVTPVSRLYVTGLFSLQDTRTSSFDHGAHSVVAYEGNVYTITATTGYALNNDVDLAIDYTFSRADNQSHNGWDNTPKAGYGNNDYGLPLGVENESHTASALLTWKISQNVIGKLRYAFYKFDEPSTGGVNDYTAHLASVSCLVKF